MMESSLITKGFLWTTTHPDCLVEDTLTLFQNHQEDSHQKMRRR